MDSRHFVIEVQIDGKLEGKGESGEERTSRRGSRSTNLSLKSSKINKPQNIIYSIWNTINNIAIIFMGTDGY